MQSHTSKLIISIVALLVGMVVLFNIERIDLAVENQIDISTFVYILGTIAVLLITMLRRLLKYGTASKMVVCLCAYLLIRLFIFEPSDFAGGIQSYITVIEVGLLMLLVLLADRLAHAVCEFEKAYGKTRLSDVRRGTQSTVEAAEQVQMAMALSRRHQRPLSVVVIEPVQYVPSEAHPEQPTRAELVESLYSCMRSTDLLLEQQERGHFVLVCQETDRKALASVVGRVCIAAAEVGVKVATGAGTFPHDALTFENLIQSAEQQLNDTLAREQADASTSPAVQQRFKRNLRLRSDFLAIGLTEKQITWLDQYRPEKRILRGHQYTLAKRIMDLTLVTCTMPAWLPLMGMLALVVKLSDLKSPAFYIQQRTGIGGKQFRMYKIRTMHVRMSDPDISIPETIATKDHARKPTNDPRVTKLGGFLRKTSLDELPQLLNVLTGDMSLVGPRPSTIQPGGHATWQTKRLEVKPGLTGLWQLFARGNMNWDNRTRYDILYIERRCLLLDMSILLHTLPVVLSRRGAY